MQEEAGFETYILLLDWDKAFDKVNQAKLLTAMTRIGIPTQIAAIINALYDEPQFSIKDGTKTTGKRKQHTGIRQGCPLSPYLFIIFHAVTMKDITDDMTQAEKHLTEVNQPTESPTIQFTLMIPSSRHQRHKHLSSYSNKSNKSLEHME